MTRRRRYTRREAPDVPPYLREWRLHRGITVPMLQAHLPLHETSIFRIEVGLSPWSREHLDAYARALDVSVADLFRRPGEIYDIIRVWNRIRDRPLAIRLLQAQLAHESAAAREKTCGQITHDDDYTC